MARVNDWEIDQEFKWLKDQLAKLPEPARNFGPVNDILERWTEFSTKLRRLIEIAEQVWVIESSVNRATSSAERLTELLEYHKP